MANTLKSRSKVSSKNYTLPPIEDYYIKDDDFDANAYIDREDKIYRTESLKEDFDDEDYWLPEENPLDDRYDYIDSKEVMDSDGFYTEYTMYYDTLEETWKDIEL